jgi:hypothetical protein
MSRATTINLRDTRPKLNWSLPTTAIAEALNRQPGDPVLTAVHKEVLEALNAFRRTEHWLDRVSKIERMRALSVIRRAILSAQEQYSQLDFYTEQLLFGEGLSFGQRLDVLNQVLENTVTELIGPVATTSESRWAVASQSARRRVSLRARDSLIVLLAELFETNTAFSKQDVTCRAAQHDFVSLVLSANGIPCPTDPDAFAKVLRRLPVRNLLASFSQQKRDD